MSQEMRPQANEAAEEMTEQQRHEQFQVRLDKLKALCDAGQDPFTITRFDVTDTLRNTREVYERQEAAYIAAHGQPE